VPIARALDTFADEAFDYLCDGAPADLNVREDFPLAALQKVIKRFAQGKAGNMLTITVANPETFAAARAEPRRYNLLRVRMGGWHENFIVLFPGHQEQHLRRPLFVEKAR
jgi:pyruvate-formate lyase